MQKIIILAFLSVLVACTPEETTVGIERRSVITFTTPVSSWQASSYSFAPVSSVVAYPADTTLPGRVYTRLTLQANGQSSQGNNLELIVTLDVSDANQLTGIYQPRYTSDRGLAQVQVFNLDNNNLEAYSLKPGDSTAVFQVRRQSQSERLIAGNFQMNLYNIRNSMETINITNGTFTDINY